MYRDSDWDNIHLADEGGIEARTRSLKRRTYNVKGPNHLWYIDLNHSLIRWYRIIFKVVDGFSLLTVSLRCIENNKASAILSCFLKCVVNTYGMPGRVRSDQSRENTSVANFMVEHRGKGRESMLTGKVCTTSKYSGFGGMCLHVFLHSLTIFLHLSKTIQFLIFSMR